MFLIEHPFFILVETQKKMKKIAVILSGCGVYDGSEIHEATFTLLAIAQNGGEYQCFAPNKSQMHVVNHLNGDEQNQTRNVLEESARIARGDVKDLKEYNAANFDALVIPGGFGAAKNLNQWAVKGPDGEIDDSVKQAIISTHKAGKYLVGLCMGPTVLAQALQGTTTALLTVGSTEEASPYDIDAISKGMESIGAKTENQPKSGITVDHEQKVITAPCYMMEASITDVYDNVSKSILELFKNM